MTEFRPASVFENPFCRELIFDDVEEDTDGVAGLMLGSTYVWLVYDLLGVC